MPITCDTNFTCSHIHTFFAFFIFFVNLSYCLDNRKYELGIMYRQLPKWDMSYKMTRSCHELYRRHILYVHIGLICGYKEAIQETYMACICTYMHLNFAYMWHIYAYMQHIYYHICAYILHIGFIYAHISSYRFFPSTHMTACPLTDPHLLSNLLMILWFWASFPTMMRPHTWMRWRDLHHGARTTVSLWTWAKLKSWLWTSERDTCCPTLLLWSAGPLWRE